MKHALPVAPAWPQLKLKLRGLCASAVPPPLMGLDNDALGLGGADPWADLHIVPQPPAPKPQLQLASLVHVAGQRGSSAWLTMHGAPPLGSAHQCTCMEGLAQQEHILLAKARVLMLQHLHGTLRLAATQAGRQERLPVPLLWQTSLPAGLTRS